MEHFPLQSLLETADFRAWVQIEHFPLQPLLGIADFRALAQMMHFPPIPKKCFTDPLKLKLC